MRDSISFDVSNRPAELMDDSKELGNLAEELAEAWDDAGSANSLVEDIFARNGAVTLPQRPNDERGQSISQLDRGMSITMPTIVHDGADDNRSLSPPKPSLIPKHQRAPSHTSDFDEFDCGESSDPENVDGMSASLEYRMAAIESLARHGSESNGSGADSVIMRVAGSLRNLGSQAGVETGASRLCSSAAELVSTLSMLAESLHRIRQTTSLANRKLKAAKDAVNELRREAEIRNEGMKWVERGNWEQKLSNRESLLQQALGRAMQRPTTIRILGATSNIQAHESPMINLAQTVFMTLTLLPTGPESIRVGRRTRWQALEDFEETEAMTAPLLASSE
ncbi:MAG: hypothetical protein Q9182_006754 [Xanthomendoza sp. 2 TL-2023]